MWQQTASLGSQSSDDKRTDSTTSTSNLEETERTPAHQQSDSCESTRVEEKSPDSALKSGPAEESLASSGNRAAAVTAFNSSIEEVETTPSHPSDADESAPIETSCRRDSLKLGSTEEVLASANSLLQHHRIERLKQRSIEIDMPYGDMPTETEIRSIYSESKKDTTPKYEQISFAASNEEPLPFFIDQVNQRGQKNSPTFRGEVEISTEEQDASFSNDEKNLSNSTRKGVTQIEDSSINAIEPKVIRSLVAKEDSKEIQNSKWYSIFGDQMNPRSSMNGGDDTAKHVDVGSSRTQMPNSIVKAIHDKPDDSVHTQMPDWIENQSSGCNDETSASTYAPGQSRTVIVHEIMREGWTWGSAWSPSGDRLAIATENHHLAVIDTRSSPIWRVKHDKRMSGSLNRGTGSIRCVAWGSNFIAIGGTGDAVSILAPTEPYPIIHTLSAGTYVGSLDWRCNSKTLITGNRDGKVHIFGIGSSEDDDSASASTEYSSGRNAIQSKILKTIDLKPAWVNAVKFSPDGLSFAVGDEDGILGVYSFLERQDGTQIEISNVANFKMEDSILDIEWSPNGKWLYSGGEDFAITIIRTDGWEAIHRIKREKWVQFLTCSSSGSHLAVGGLSSEISILDAEGTWQTAIILDLKGMNPLSAKWHPKDQFLVITGQHSNVLAIETTKSRYVQGHCFHSISPILAVEFSPDGRMAIVGNKEGVVTIFKVAGSAFSVCYEMVLDCLGTLSIKWSPNGAFIVIASESKIVVLSRRNHDESMSLGASGFAVAKIIRGIGNICGISVDPTSQFIAVCGSSPSILDATADFTKSCGINSLKNDSLPLPSSSNFSSVLEMGSSSRSLSLAASWSPDGKWLALVGRNQNLAFFDTSSDSPSKWRRLFEVKTSQAGLALAWGPPTETGLQYCAYAGEDKKVCILEIRDTERSWEMVLEVPRNGVVYDLDWDSDGLLAAAISDGTVTIMDLSYLRCGLAVNEMDYNWQRQALTCFTEIQRNKGKNCMQTLRWVPKAPGSDSLLAIGGTDGEVEILDLTAERHI
ncbi:unnamed protein product [Cylindrotheca closterium]|uniref:Anaphase-promoting complex subunit 4 WD40 domain-containing protein n=1 Tax=Cylindrotheca closterium TaxID=2856 RepID=A0AAD2FIG5_9STRA|nr:unnamed protein product [Cylindrotheca closterium]